MRWAKVKLVISNGKELEVRDVGPVVYRLEARTVPIKCNGRLLLDDDAARDLVAALASVQRCQATPS